MLLHEVVQDVQISVFSDPEKQAEEYRRVASQVEDDGRDVLVSAQMFAIIMRLIARVDG